MTWKDDILLHLWLDFKFNLGLHAKFADLYSDGLTLTRFFMVTVAESKMWGVYGETGKIWTGAINITWTPSLLGRPAQLSTVSLPHSYYERSNYATQTGQFTHLRHEKILKSLCFSASTWFKSNTLSCMAL